MHDSGTSDPAKIGDYAVLGRLGHGAMGRVYLARSPGGRPLAVKVVRPELADDPGFRERFRQEVAAMRAVGGFWTAAVVDADPDGLWLATEYVPGPTLRAAVDSHGPLPVPALRRLVAGLAEALRAIHGAGLVHRDLKPANVLLAADGPRVIDFGIAKALEHTGLTATGMFVGTPGFLSPEQIEGRDATPASDVFALGAVLVYAATGAGPFGTGDAPALMYRAVHAEPSLDGVPDELRALIARCLARSPSARPTPADLLAEAGTPDAAEWLPEPVRAMVTEQETELGKPAPRPPTKAYTKAGPPLPFGRKGAAAPADTPPATPAAPPATPPATPAATPPATPAATPPEAAAGGNGAIRVAGEPAAPVPGSPGQAAGAAPVAGAPGQAPGAIPVAGSAGQAPGAAPAAPAGVAGGGGNAAGWPSASRAVFQVSRISAAVLGAVATVLAFVCLSISQQASAEKADGVSLGYFVLFVLLAVPAVRMWWIVLRPRRWLEVSADGLTLGRGGRARLLPWSQLERVRVVEKGRRSWLVVWSRLPIEGEQRYLGGYKVFPVGHERRRAARRHEMGELRAALGWYGRAVYDPSP